eukprot:jgi/Chrzof1/6991/Cz02g06230.t1
MADTASVIGASYPDLLDLVDNGTLIVHKRPPDYQERRSDGYQEPLLVFIIGTAHVSQQSALDVHRVIMAVQPENVVVELCKSRTALLEPDKDSTKVCDSNPNANQHQQQQQQQQLLSLLQQEAQQQSISTAQVAGNNTVTTVGNSSTRPSHPASQLESTISDIGGNLKETQASGSNASTASEEAGSSPAAWPSPDHSQRHNSQQHGRSKARNPLLLSGNSFLSAARRSLDLGGQSAFVLRLFMAGQAEKAARSLGVNPGEEFTAAAAAAESVGAQIVLGDRPIEITLQRAWEALSWQRRLRLCVDLVVGILTPLPANFGKEMVEQLKSDDALTALYNEVSAQYPELVSPLLHERDLYLAWSLKRSKAVNGSQRVVGVVGKGHFRGIVHALKHDQQRLRFTDLVSTTKRQKSKHRTPALAVGRLVLELLLGAGLYAAWVAATAASGSAG